MITNLSDDVKFLYTFHSTYRMYVNNMITFASQDGILHVQHHPVLLCTNSHGWSFSSWCITQFIMPRGPDRREGAISVSFVRPSVHMSVHLSVCPSVAKIANNSRTQRLSVPKFGKKVSDLKCDSHTSFKVKQSKIGVTDGRGHSVSAEPGITMALSGIVFHSLQTLIENREIYILQYVFNAPVGSDPVRISQRSLVLGKLK